MNKGNKLYEGKAKIIYETKDKNLVIPLLNNYVFCYSKKFESNGSEIRCKYLKGLDYFLKGHSSNQSEIINFIDFCKTIGTTNTLKEIPADFNFYDFKSNKKWNLDLSSNYLNLLLNKQKLIPHTKITDYFSLFKFYFVNDISIKK